MKAGFEEKQIPPPSREKHPLPLHPEGILVDKSPGSWVLVLERERERKNEREREKEREREREREIERERDREVRREGAKKVKKEGEPLFAAH